MNVKVRALCPGEDEMPDPALLDQADSLSARRRALHELLEARAAEAERDSSRLALELEQRAAAEAALMQEAAALRESERALRRALQEGQRREAALKSALARASEERSAARAEASRAAASLTDRELALDGAQATCRALRTRVKDLELQDQQAAFIRGHAAPTRPPSGHAAARAAASPPRPPSAAEPRRREMSAASGEELESAQQAYIGRVLGAGSRRRAVPQSR